MVWEDLVFHSLQNIPKGRNSLQNSMVLQEKQKKKPWTVTRWNPQMLQLTLKISSIIDNMK